MKVCSEGNWANNCLPGKLMYRNCTESPSARASHRLQRAERSLCITPRQPAIFCAQYYFVRNNSPMHVARAPPLKMPE